MTKDYHGRRGGGGRGGGRRGGGGERRNKVPDIDTSDPVQNMFGLISKVLDARHDKRERIVKLSRDITIESKRIIFCLHRIKSDDDKMVVLEEAEGRLTDMKGKLWYALAKELKGEDHYQFIKAYSAGLQEWVEALSFYYYLSYDKLIKFQEVENELIFEEREELRMKSEDYKKLDLEDGKQSDKGENLKEGTKDVEEEEGPIIKKESNEVVATQFDEVSLSGEPSSIISVTVPQSEYILGLADLTGELMRNAINSLGSGHMDVCFTLLDILQNMSDGFNRLPRHEAPRDIGQKVYTLKQSCKKVENACYAISVRGSEIPKNHLADIFTQQRDEGHVEKYGGGENECYSD